jgi:Domain of unknown function (DUF4282)
LFRAVNLPVAIPHDVCPRRLTDSGRQGSLRGHFLWRFGAEENPMFAFSDLFQWERFITPQIIKIFYWLAVAVSVLAGLSGIGTGLAMMLVNPIAGLISVVISMIGIVIGVIFARIAAEFILIVFRISEHLGAIRARGEGM